MKKLSFILSIIYLIVLSCSQKPDSASAQKVSLDSLLSHPEKYVNKTVQLQGTAVHVCRHTGKRLFITDSKGQNRFKLVTGSNLSKFDVSWEGSDVIATGIVKEQRIDEAYLTAKESDIQSSEKEEFQHTGEHKGEKEQEETDSKTQLKQIQNLRQTLQESGKEYLSFYSLECNHIEVVPVQ